MQDKLVLMDFIDKLNSQKELLELKQAKPIWLIYKLLLSV